MAGYGRFLSSISSGSFLFTRTCVLRSYKNVSIKVTKSSERDPLPSKPKRPMSAFLLFSKSLRDRYVRDNVKYSVTKMSKMASIEWKTMNLEQKEEYVKEYNERRKQYLKELEDYNNSTTIEERLLTMIEQKKGKGIRSTAEFKKQLTLLGKPKRPLSAFLLYLQFNKWGKDSTSTYKEWLREMHDTWREMTDSEKEVYIVEAMRLMESYKKNLEIWEKDMVRSGNSDLLVRRIPATSGSKNKMEEE